MKKYPGLFMQPPGPEFLIFDDKNVSLPPGTGGVPFKWEIYFLLSG